MNENKIFLEDCANLSLQYPEQYPVPTKNEIKSLKKDDFVLLIFSSSKGESERMWVRIEKHNTDNDSFKGTLINKPMLLKNIKENDSVEFNSNNISNYSTKEEQKRIIDEYNETGRIPTGHITDTYIIKTIEDFIEMGTKDKDEFNRLYRIRRSDSKFFKEELEIFKDEILQNNNPSDLSIETDTDLFKMFLSLIYMIVLPQIIRKIDRGYMVDISHKEYYLRIVRLLEQSINIFQHICKKNIELVEELRDLHSGPDISKLAVAELPIFYSSLIEEAIDKVIEIQNN